MCIRDRLYPDGTRNPIGYRSRSLKNAEINYSVTEKECLSVVWGCQILRPNLEGDRFVIYTDHQALKWLLVSNGPMTSYEVI